jgi:hypothetical protein
MARINFENLPITSDQARGARNYFGWPQAKAAEESGLPLHKLKRFEAGNFIPDEDFLTALRAFYEQRGYKFEDTPEPGQNAKNSGMVFPAGVVGVTGGNQGATGNGRPAQATVHHMRIALQDPEMGNVLDLIEANEDKIKDLLEAPVKDSFWGGFNDDSQATHGQIVKLLSANGLLFAKLFGRDVAGKPDPNVLAGQSEPQNQADLLHKTNADTHLAVAGHQDAKDRLKKVKPATSLLSAIFG